MGIGELVLSIALSFSGIDRDNLEYLKNDACVQFYRDTKDSSYVALFPLEKVDGALYYYGLRDSSLTTLQEEAKILHDSYHSPYLSTKSENMGQLLLDIDLDGNHIIDGPERKFYVGWFK